MSYSLKHLKDMVSRQATGMTKDEAHAKGICIACKKPISEHGPSSPAGIREYQISGIYGDECWDKFLGVDADGNYTNQDPDLKPSPKVPHPGYCRHPEKCAGLSACPRDISCID
jgi:hypothetical protein